MLARSTVIRWAVLPAILCCCLPAWPQARKARQPVVKNTNSATYVLAEMTSGTLDPSRSAPGDEVRLKLKDDVRSNGVVILSKGTSITGVVRRVDTLEAASPVSGVEHSPRSMMAIEWITPTPQGKTPHELMMTLQSVFQTGSPAALVRTVRQPSDVLAARLVSVPPPLMSTRANGQLNVALMNMPSVVEVDSSTAAVLHDAFGITSDGRSLYRVGRDTLRTPDGSKLSLHLFSYMSNDTLITSPDSSFQITAGAEMQLLVGIRRK